MIMQPEREFVGYIDVDLGKQAVRVPIQKIDPLKESATSVPLASFECDGDTCEILVRGDVGSAEVNQALQGAATEAVRHLSRKILN